MTRSLKLIVSFKYKPLEGARLFFPKWHGRIFFWDMRTWPICFHWRPKFLPIPLYPVTETRKFAHLETWKLDWPSFVPHVSGQIDIFAIFFSDDTFSQCSVFLFSSRTSATSRRTTFLSGWCATATTPTPTGARDSGERRSPKALSTNPRASRPSRTNSRLKSSYSQ